MSGNNMKNNTNSRGYELVFVPFMEDEFTFITRDSLEEIDSITTSFDCFKDMIDSINLVYGNQIDVTNAYIKRIDSNKRYNIMYSGDIFDKDKVKLKYKEFLLSNPGYFSKSSVSKVSLRREAYSLESSYINCCFLSYFKDGNYRKIRGAYFELKKLGYGDVVTKRKRVDNEGVNHVLDSSYEYFSDDSELDFLFNNGEEPDWDTIYNLYSVEDINRLVKRKSKVRGIK